MAKGFKIELNLPTKSLLERKFFSDDVKLFFGQEAARQMNPYVPYEQGTLSKNYVVTPKYIEYQQPYAHKQYNGENFNFRKEMHPLATAKWDKAMMRARKDRLIDAVQDYIKKRKG